MLMALNAIGYYTISVFLPNQTIFLGKFPAHKAFYLSTAVMLCLIVGNILSAYLADKMDKISLYTFGAISSAILAYPMFYALAYFSLSLQLVVMGAFAICLGFCFGPRAALLVEIFPAEVRFTGVALTMSVSNGFLGGTTPLVAASLVEYLGSPIWPFMLVMIASVLTLFALKEFRSLQSGNVSDYLRKVA